MTNPETQKSCEEIAQCIVACELASRVPMGKTLRETEDYKIIRDNLLLKITEALLSERQIAEKLREQLPEGMKDCTIIFKQCSLGHGWLTANNWIQHECLTCERDGLREQVSGLVEAIKPLVAVKDTGILTPLMFIQLDEALKSLQAKQEESK